MRPGVIAVRIALFGAAVALLLNHVVDIRQFWASIALFALIGLRQPISLRNLFLIYTYLLFAIAGSYFFPRRNDLISDLLMIQAVFMVAFWTSEAFSERRPNGLAAVPRPHAIKVTRWVLYGLFIAGLFLLGADIVRFGLRGFYSGRAMVAAIETYGRQDFGAGVSAIANYGSQIAAIAVAALYVGLSVRAGIRVRYLPLVLLFILLPILRLQRGIFAFGVMLLLVVMLIGRRGSERTYRRVAIAIAAVIVVGTLFGVLRDRALFGASRLSVREGVLAMVAGEFSPVVAFTEIKDDIDTLHVQHGRTIVLPLAFKVIPRSWLPSKPMNSSGYYTSKIHPEQASAGFFIAPSIFGDLYLNFKWSGVMVGVLLLGVAAGRLDRRFACRDFELIPTYLIIFYYGYVILRNNIADSAIVVLLSFVLLWAGKARLTQRLRRRPAAHGTFERRLPVVSS